MTEITNNNTNILGKRSLFLEGISGVLMILLSLGFRFELSAEDIMKFFGLILGLGSIINVIIKIFMLVRTKKENLN